MSDTLVSAQPPARPSVREVFPVWPRQRSTAVALLVLLVVQASAFFAITQSAFFATDDYWHFILLQERSVLRYLLSPILGVYPAPGHRLMTLFLQHLFALNFTVARLVFLVLLAATTILLAQLVRIFAHSDRYWTVLLLAPFAFSLTLLSPVWWWSSGLPVFPLLLCTSIALLTWLRFQADPGRKVWLAVTVAAIAAAGGFYSKFMLIPVYLLFIRVAILPRLLGVPGGLRKLWTERLQWVALATPAAAFLAVYFASGLAGRMPPTDVRPFFRYLAHAWFGATVPVSFLNVELDGAGPFSLLWAIAVSQILFWAAVVATWRRCGLALRAWALFAVVFLLNAGVVGLARLSGLNAHVLPYTLRYYPEVVFFLPLALALGLRSGSERRPGVAWERTLLGQAALVLFACVHLAALILWGPTIVRNSEGAHARQWFENLKNGLESVAGHVPPRIIDSDTPEYVMPQWMAPRNRVSTILAIARADVAINEAADTMYVVRDDGRLAAASFRATTLLVAGVDVDDRVQLASRTADSAGVCLEGSGFLRYEPGSDTTGDGGLAVRLSFSRASAKVAALEVESFDVDRPFRRLHPRPNDHRIEVLDLGTSRLRSLTLKPSEGDVVCVDRVEVGSLSTREAGARSSRSAG